MKKIDLATLNREPGHEHFRDFMKWRWGIIARKEKINKGIILAAGDGDRLGSLTAICPKALLPLNGKQLIWYPIEALAAAGVRDIAIVVGYLKDKVTESLGNGSDFGVRLQYI